MNLRFVPPAGCPAIDFKMVFVRKILVRQD
jgi:hypothetical protein